jgi:signal transduction histidine kinase
MASKPEQKNILYPAIMDENHPSEDRSSSEVISLVAHELKNPIASIRGYTELLLSGAIGELNTNQTKFLNTILSNILRMTDLINDLGDSARIDSGRELIEIGAVQPTKIINEVVDAIIPQIEDKGLKLTRDIPQQLPQIQADSARFYQVIINLLTNATKYTLPGGEIVISAVEMKDKIQFAIQDSGIGIKDQDQKNIFQEYYRTEDVREREISGTGLGLYISKRLIELQGGEIWFASEYGKGTTFYFTMKTA